VWFELGSFSWWTERTFVPESRVNCASGTATFHAVGGGQRSEKEGGRGRDRLGKEAHGDMLCLGACSHVQIRQVVLGKQVGPLVGTGC
jgi:hypothetical protein